MEYEQHEPEERYDEFELDLDDLKKMHDKAYNNSTVTRERAADDLVFYHVTQWDDSLLQTSDLAYRGEFNILKKAGRQTMADLRSNPVQVDFEPIDDTREDAAELIDGLYRSDDRNNMSQESYFNASQEAIVCGVGAWELFTEYETTRSGSRNQVIRRKPLHEANNRVFWDPNSRLMDKSDADFVSIVVPYSKESYEELVEELTGEEDYQCSMASFKTPQQSYAFPWVTGNFEWIYVGEIYVRDKVSDTVFTFLEPMTGSEVFYLESQVEEMMDELIDTGHIMVAEKEIERFRVLKYIVSGERILACYEIAGGNIPVVPVYGERAYVEGQETWEGIVRLAKDPQRLRNFMMSYVADIASRSPRPKPIFWPEQINGYSDMYEINGADNNYPYLLMNRTTKNGEPMPPGPVAQMPEQQVPQSVAALIQLTRESVEDTVGAGAPRDIQDMDLSGDAITKIQAIMDMNSFVYQENMKHAKRRDGEIYAGMAKVVYDAPRKVMLTLPDGTRTQAQISKQVIDQETGDIKVLNDLSNAEFDVYADVGPSYKSQKDMLRKELTMQLQAMPSDDPMRELIWLTYAKLMDGVDTQEIRDYAKKQMILKGYRDPETPEEQQMLAAAQQQAGQNDAAAMIGQAEMMKGQAAVMREQREMQNMGIKAQQEAAKIAIEQFNAQTDRFKAEVDAQAAGHEAAVKEAATIGKAYRDLRGSIRG